MKTGEAAKILGVDPKTIRNWIDDYGLSRFFSTSATGEDGSFQRLLTESDLLVLNTVRALKGRGVTNWDRVAEYLESGEREREFPQNAISGDPRTIPVQQAEVSAKAMATLTERDNAIARMREMAAEIEELRAAVNRLQNEKDAQREEYYKQLIDLNRQIGRLEGQLEMYRKNEDQVNGLGEN
jgi:DNA-binding transcriptional MerR regulator